jgi:hypothetical protein
MHRTAALLLLFAVSPPSIAAVSAISHGQSLVATCQAAMANLQPEPDAAAVANQGDAFVCLAYVAGVMSAAQQANDLARLRFAVATGGQATAKPFKLYCFDWEMSYGHVARLIIDYAKRHPQQLRRPAGELALRALQSAFPCS